MGMCSVQIFSPIEEYQIIKRKNEKRNLYWLIKNQKSKCKRVRSFWFVRGFLQYDPYGMSTFTKYKCKPDVWQCRRWSWPGPGSSGMPPLSSAWNWEWTRSSASCPFPSRTRQRLWEWRPCTGSPLAVLSSLCCSQETRPVRITQHSRHKWTSHAAFAPVKTYKTSRGYHNDFRTARC